MINGHELYKSLSVMIPLYVAMILAYASVRWWKIFTPDQCAAINRYVAMFAIPSLFFHFMYKNDPYAMDLKFIAADTLQKTIVLIAMVLWTSFSSKGSLDWLITIFSLSTLPNNLVLGIPLLVAMYGEYCQNLLVQIIMMQCTIWTPLLIFLFEYRAAKISLVEQFPNATKDSCQKMSNSEEVRLSVLENVEVKLEIQVEPYGFIKMDSTRLSGHKVPESGAGKQMPPSDVMTKLILIRVWGKLIQNPNIYSSLLGILWSLIHFRWHIEMPIVVENSITILSDTGLGTAMFSMGIYMALQPSLLPSGKAKATYAMAARFIVGPAVMFLASLIVGIRGNLLRVAIIQAALPQSTVPFIFAKEYNVHPEILCTSAIFGMVIAIPVTLTYYILLGV